MNESIEEAGRRILNEVMGTEHRARRAKPDNNFNACCRTTPFFLKFSSAFLIIALLAFFAAS